MIGVTPFIVFEEKLSPLKKKDLNPFFKTVLCNGLSVVMKTVDSLSKKWII